MALLLDTDLRLEQRFLAQCRRLVVEDRLRSDDGGVRLGSCERRC